MVQHQGRKLLHLSLLVTCATHVHAAEPISLQHTSFSNVKQMFIVPAQGFLKANQNVNKDQLLLLKEHRDRKQVTHARMQQYYAGFPVFGGYAIFHGTSSASQMWASNNPSVSMNGTVYQGLKSDLGQPATDFVTRSAEALAHFKAQYPNAHISDDTVTPMIYMDEKNLGHWAYKVSVFIIHEDQIPERQTAIIDAQTFHPFIQWNDVKRAKVKAIGRGFGGNVQVGKYQYGVDRVPLQIMRENRTGMCYMENAHTKVVDMMNRYEGRNFTMRFPCLDSTKQADGSFQTGYFTNGYDKINGAYSPSNDALNAGTVIYDMYKNWYGMLPLEENGKAMPLIMRVHFGLRYDNAFWDGEQMTFGDGGLDLYPLVSLGIGAHEISHGFTERHSDLIYMGQSGGMNESRR